MIVKNTLHIVLQVNVYARSPTVTTKQTYVALVGTYILLYYYTQ